MRAAAVLAALATVAPSAAAQRLAAGAGVAVASRLLVDGDGTTVRLRPAAYLAIDVALPLRLAAATTIGTVRVAYADARASDGGASWSAGGVVQADLAVGVRGPVWRGARAHAAAGATVLVGPRDVRPFAGTPVSPLVEVGADAGVRGALRADVRVQAYRVAPDGGDAGAVVRLLVGVTRAR